MLWEPGFMGKLVPDLKGKGLGQGVQAQGASFGSSTRPLAPSPSRPLFFTAPAAKRSTHSRS